MLTYWKRTRWTGFSRFIAVDAAFGLAFAALISSIGLAVLSVFAGLVAVLLRRRRTPKVNV